MAGSRTYGPYPLLSAGSMAATISTNGADVSSLPYGAVEFVYTGTPTGTIKIEGSIDNVPSASSVVTWYDTGVSVTGPSGSAGSQLVSMTLMGYKWLRATYTRVSGTGALTVNFFAKGGGGVG